MQFVTFYGMLLNIWSAHDKHEKVLDGFPSFKSIDCTTQLGVIHKLAEGALDAIIHVIDEDVEEHWSQD